MTREEWKEYIKNMLSSLDGSVKPEELFLWRSPNDCFACKGDKFRVAMWELLAEGQVELTHDPQLVNIK